MANDSTYGQVIPLPKAQDVAARDPSPVALASLTDVMGAQPADPAVLSVLFPALARADDPILWVSDHASRRENGMLYTPGLAACGLTQPILQISVSHPRDVLWTMEEGAACAGLSAVVGEIYGGPAVLDFTATKRLALRAETSGVPVCLIRSGDPGGLSAARKRWRVRSLPSQANGYDAQAPGAAQWDLDLFRTRTGAPGHWVARHDPTAPRAEDRLCLVSRSVDRTLDAGDQPLQNATAT